MFGFAILTVILWQVPGGSYVIYPFTILGTWFHEMAHGIAAMVFGAEFLKLELYPNGSGIAFYSGGIFFGNIGRAAIAAAGPIGPTIAGSLFIISSRSRTGSRFSLFLLGLVLVFSDIIWVRTIFGFIIIIILGILILTIAIFGAESMQTITIRFLGVQACVSVYQSVGYLFSSGGVIENRQFLSDTAVISQNLFLPYWFWGGSILIFSIISIYKSLRFATK